MGKYVVADGWHAGGWQRNIGVLPILVITVFCFGLIIVRAQPAAHKSNVANNHSAGHHTTSLPSLSAPQQSSLPTLTTDTGQPAATNGAASSSNSPSKPDDETTASSKARSAHQPWLVRLSNSVQNLFDSPKSQK